jgi:replicative DNA helicase
MQNELIPINADYTEITRRYADMMQQLDIGKTSQEMTMIRHEKEAIGGLGNPDEVLKTGIASIDNTIGGFTVGELAVIGARPSVGKTAFAMNCALGWAKNGIPGMVFSLEMKCKEILYRMAAAEIGIDNRELKKGLPHNLSASVDAIHRIASYPILIDDSSSYTADDIYYKMREYKHRNPGAKYAVIDYLQFMTHDDGDNQNLAVGNSSKRLKQMGKDLDVAVILLSQFSRAAVKETPNLSHLRDSGSIEQDADLVGLLYRTNEADRTRATLNFAKNRNGPTGVIELSYAPEITTFYDLRPVIK